MAAAWSEAGCLVHPARADGSKVPLPVEGGGLEVELAVFPATYQGGPRKGEPHPRAGQANPRAGQHKYGWKRVAVGELVYPWAQVLRDLRGRCDGIGVFCGSPSGGLEMVELEGRAVGELDRLAAAARERGVEHLWRRLETGCSETSPSGGIHWFLRVADGPALGNTKLAMRPNPDDPGKPQVIAETRGQGGWVVVAGSYGRTHASGKPYVLRSGSPLTIPVFTAAERDELYAVFGTIDELPEVTSPPRREPSEAVQRARAEGVLLVGDDFNQRGSWAEVFPAGWARLSEGERADVWSKHGAGGRKTADLFHESDSLYIWATGTPGSQRKLSKFAAYAWLRHRGDFRAAAAELAAEGYGDAISSRDPTPAVETRPPLRVEQRVSGQEFVELDQWRVEAAAALAQEIARPGFVHLDGPPGSGKSTLTRREVVKLGRSVTAAKSHEFCAEIVAEYRAMGVDAAAFPQLDERSCANYGEARRAVAAGLPVAACVCPGCPLKAACREEGYLAGVRAAAGAHHVVVTHARLERAAERLCEKADCVVIEENAADVLRPVHTAGSAALSAVADLLEQLVEAERRSWILDGLDLVIEDPSPAATASTYAEFEAWSLPAGEAVEQGQEPDGGREYPGGFLGLLWRVADLLADRCRSAVRGGSPPGAVEVEIPTAGSLPKSPEYVLWRAIESLRRVDPRGVLEMTPQLRDALGVVLAAATGRAGEVYVQVEQGQHGRYAEVVTVGRARLPAERVPVLILDGSASTVQVRMLAGSEVVSIGGGMPIRPQQLAIQYAKDILPTTSTSKVRRIIQGLARAYPGQRVGLILHKRHFDELYAEGGLPLLAADVAARVTAATYFGAGDDRGSNRFQREADLLLVLGTHRPPPAEIRRRLLQFGQVEAAQTVGTWGDIERHGLTPEGLPIVWRGRGYAEEVWAAAADSVIRATSLQSIARARSICPDGIAMIAATTERLDIPTSAGASIPMSDPMVDRVVEAVAVEYAYLDCASSGSTAPKNPIGSIRVFGRSWTPEVGAAPPASTSPGATLDQLVARLGVPVATARKWIARAVESGQLLRSGCTTSTRYSPAFPLAAQEPREEPGRLVAAPEVDRPVERVQEPAVASVVPAAAVVLRVEAEIPADEVPVVEPVVVVEHLAAALPEIVSAPAPAPAPAEPGWPWLAAALAPERYPVEVEDLRIIRAAQAYQLRDDLLAWNQEVSPVLLPRLVDRAAREARARGQPPPPLSLVAATTSAWCVQTVDVWG